MQGPANRLAKFGLGSSETTTNPSLHSNQAIFESGRSESQVGRVLGLSWTDLVTLINKLFF